jgi:PASTA domain-containing protein
MGDDRNMWTDGRDAWERLAATDGQPGGDPLGALSDVGRLRRLLDEAELEAVRAARRAGRSWAEIAIKLGVTRQSAWERWRDLDAEPAASPAPAAAVDDPYPDTPQIVERSAAIARRRSWITVPDVIGMSFDVARTKLSEINLFAVAADGDAPDEFAAPHAVVTDQSPEAGARAMPAAPVRLWFDRGGGTGVREPRRPRPTPRVEHERIDEPSGDPLG